MGSFQWYRQYQSSHTCAATFSSRGKEDSEFRLGHSYGCAFWRLFFFFFFSPQQQAVFIPNLEQGAEGWCGAPSAAAAHQFYARPCQIRLGRVQRTRSEQKLREGAAETVAVTYARCIIIIFLPLSAVLGKRGSAARAGASDGVRCAVCGVRCTVRSADISSFTPHTAHRTHIVAHRSCNRVCAARSHDQGNLNPGFLENGCYCII